MSALCKKCGQDVVRRGLFWVLASEAHSQLVTFCPGPGDDRLHEVEGEDDE
jgi:hypothetical protein